MQRVVSNEPRVLADAGGLLQLFAAPIHAHQVPVPEPFQHEQKVTVPTANVEDCRVAISR